MAILTDIELTRLLCVKTTVDEARQILRRNSSLLEGVKKLEHDMWCGKRPAPKYANTCIGCPHCSGLTVCDNCAWTKAGFTKCLNATFGGVTGRDKPQSMAYVHYGVASEHIYVTNSFHCSWRKLRYYAQQRMWRDIEDMKKLLLGHIEWALEVIHNDD